MKTFKEFSEGWKRAVAMGTATSAAGALTGAAIGLNPVAGAVIAGVGYAVMDAKDDLNYKPRRKKLANAIREAVRSPERAAKLSDYLAKRHGENEYRFKSVNQNPDEREDFESARHHHKAELTKYPTTSRFKIRSNKEWHDSNSKKFKRDFVPVKDLTLTQGKVWNHGVKEKLKGQGPGDTGPIRVIHYNDKHYVVDGHHRVAAAKLKGDDEIEAHVMKIPKTPQQKKKEKRGF